MRIAFIPPYSLLRYTEHTNYQLCLPHLMSSHTYKNTYLRYCRDKSVFVIMDNGAAEGRLTDTDTLMHLATTMRPNEVVIPDVMGNMQETVYAAMKFHDEVVPPMHMNPLPFGLMFVVQGQTMAEVLACADWAIRQMWIDSIGIPRHLVTTIDDRHARVHIANTLQERYPRSCKPLHFLGGNPTHPREVEYLSNPRITMQEHVRGMDTSMPFNFAHEGIYIADQTGKTASRPDKYFYLGESAFPQQMVDDNVNYFLKYHEGVGVA